MTTLLIGATGQVGFELARRLLRDGDVTATTRSGASPVAGLACVPLDVGDLDAVRRCIETHHPAVVINATAHTAVDRAESEPELAFHLNAHAPATMAAACRDIGARLVHYSTDYVFDGASRTPYRVDDPTAPLGVYGASKRAGEVAILESGADHLILRTAWVYAERGSNFLRTMLRLARERDHLRIVDDQIGSPTPAWLIAEVSLALLSEAAGGVHHVVARGRTSWCGFAQAIFDEASARGLLPRIPRVTPIPTSAYPTPARRPAFSVLDTGTIRARGIALPEWRDALRRTFDAAGDDLNALLS